MAAARQPQRAIWADEERGAIVTSEAILRPGLAYKRPAANVVRALCIGCGLEFDQLLAEETAARVEARAELAESEFRARLAKKVRDYVAREAGRTKDPEILAGRYAGLLDILRAEGIWAP